MKKKLFLFMMTLFGIAAEAQAADVVINSTNFPDEIFRYWILTQDYGADGILTDEEIAGVNGIQVDNWSISDLKGIEFFTALQYLYCYDNQLTTLDVSNNTALRNLYCSNNRLTTLDLSNNPALLILSCGENQLTTLDVSKNTALWVLDCSNNQLTTLDVSNNTALMNLICSSNQLTTLDVSNTTAYSFNLYCSNNRLTTLDVSKNTALFTLNCCNNQLTTLDVSKNKGLETLDCSNNQLTTLDVSNNNWLLELSCHGNRIRGEGMQMLVNGLNWVYMFDENGEIPKKLYVYKNETPTGNEMTTLQVAAAKVKRWHVLMYDHSFYDDWEDWLYEVWVDYPGVCYIDAMNFPDENFRNWILAQDYGADGILTDAEIAGVTEMNVSYKDISDLSGIGFFTALQTLDCRGNKLTTLDLSNNTALNFLVCYHNRIRSEGMQTLVNSLYDRSEMGAGVLHVYMDEPDTGNEMTKEQVAAVKVKNWHVQMYDYVDDGWDWVDYSGVDLGTAIDAMNFTEEMPAVIGPFDVYDLKGYCVLHQVTSLDGLPASVYIVNGKKMLKK